MGAEMTPKERVDDIMKRCWNLEKLNPPPPFAGLDVEIERAIREAVLAERERCVKVCEELDSEGRGSPSICAAAIRALE